MGGCASTNERDVKDEPIEKAEANNAQSIPKIEINGPSVSTSQNGLSNNHTGTGTPPQNVTPQKATAEPETPERQQSTPKTVPEEKKEPIFPHVSPFKPQFDYRKDVTLSYRSSKIFDDNSIQANGVAGDMSIDTSTLNREHQTSDTTSQEGDEFASPRSLDRSDEGKSTVERDFAAKDSFTREVTKAIEESENVESVRVDESTADQDQSRKAVNKAALAEHDETGATRDGDSSTTKGNGQEESRGNILADFLSKQVGPVEASSDDDEANFHFGPKTSEDEDFLANQVDDDDIDQSRTAPNPLVNEDRGAKGDCEKGEEILSALKRCADGGDVHLQQEDKQKLNELLNAIEQIAEKNGRFD